MDNTREFDPSILTVDLASANSGEGSSSKGTIQEQAADDIAHDPFASYFTSSDDPMQAPKVLITTSPKATKVTHDFCEDLVGVFPGGEFIRRQKGKKFEMGKIAGWAADRNYKHLIVVNEDMKNPSRFQRCGCMQPFMSARTRCYDSHLSSKRSNRVL